jgi:hypothetical protein
MAVLGLFRPFRELYLSQVIPDIVIPSMFRSSNLSSYIWLPFVYFLYSAVFRLSIYVSVPVQSLGFNVIYYVSMLDQLIQFYTRFDFPTSIFLFSWSKYFPSLHFFLEWEIFQTKFVEKIKTQFLFKNFSPENNAFRRKCGKNLQSEAGHKWEYGACALHAGYMRPQIHTQVV